MKMLSVDIETTGLDPDHCQILEIGAVLFDTDTYEVLGTFERLVRPSGMCTGEPYAIAMNGKLFYRLANGEGVHLWEATTQLQKWLHEHQVYHKITICGKNFASFDSKFLDKCSHWRSIPKSHRVLDISSMYYNPDIHDERLPSTEECKTIAGLPGEVAHTALADAMDVVRLVTYKLDRLRRAPL